MRLRNVVVAVAIILPTVGLGGSALADGNGQFKKVPISFTGGPDLPGAVPGGQIATDCTSGGVCVYAFNYGTGATVAGDLMGDYVDVFAVGAPVGGGRAILTADRRLHWKREALRDGVVRVVRKRRRRCRR